MSNLSELLPTGGGQNAVDFVASGTLSSGQVVVLRSDGTVEAVSGVAQALGSEAVFESAVSEHTAATFDSNSNKVVIAYKDNGNSQYGTAVVGTVSGTSISFGTPVVFLTGRPFETSATFDSNSNKVVIACRNLSNSSYGTAIVGTVSGTSISFGSPVIYNSGMSIYTSATFDSNANKVVIAFYDQPNANRGTAIVGTVSGTSISFGSKVVFELAATYFIATTFDSNSNKVVIAYTDLTNSYAIVGTVSGTSISFGSAAQFESARTDAKGATFDSNANKVVIAYGKSVDDGASIHTTAVVGTVSGTSISFGTPLTITSSGVSDYVTATYNSSANKVVISYRDGTNSNYGTLVNGTVSGTSITVGSPVVFNAANSTNYISSTYDSNADKVVIAYQDGGNSGYGTAIVFQNGSTNSADFIGITAGAISDTATGAVNVYGGINEAQTGLTIGSDYYVQDDGSISTTSSAVKIGQAISATTINMMDLT